MAENKVINMEESSEGATLKEKRSLAKRPRHRSSDTEEENEESLKGSFLHEAKSIQTNLRIFLKNFDKKMNNTTRNVIEEKIDRLIKIIEIFDKNNKYKEKEKGDSMSELIQKVVKETLESPQVLKAIRSQMTEKSMPRLSEVNMPSKNPSVLLAGTSEESNEPILRNIEITENESFEVVRSKRSRKKAGSRKKRTDGNQNEEIKAKTSVQDNTSKTEKPKTMAEIVKSLPSKPSNTSKGTYLTISGSGKSPVDIINGLPSPAEIGVKASIVRPTKSGSILVRLEDSSHANKVIGWQGLRQHGLQAKLALRKKPKLEVKGVPPSWGAEELAEFLWERLPEKSVPTPLVQGDLRPIFSSMARNGFSKNWVLEVHPMVRFQLLEIGCLYGGWWSLTFKDYLDAPRCTKCQGYDHTKATCKVDAIICIWCSASGHMMKECPKKKSMVEPTCVNCVRANKHPTQTKHKSGSRECPVHLTWCKEVAKRTYYE